MSRSYNVLPAAREYAAGIGQAVADRTVNRRILREFSTPGYVMVTLPRDDSRALDDQVRSWCKSNGYEPADPLEYEVVEGDDVEVKLWLWAVGRYDTERWEDVARRVATGNALLEPRPSRYHWEFDALHHHLRQASLLMSGRHLQHGDETQPERPQEVFTNCSTAATSFLTFKLLLSGSGVGRCYDDEMMVVDWSKLPVVVCVIDDNHKDVQSGEILALTRQQAEHVYAGARIHYFRVPDSREGWAKAIEKMETMAYKGIYREDVLLIDFSDVRPRGAPIKGMQNRPASGPGPLMAAIANVARVRDAKMDPWRQAMYVDHYLAECVLVGGARRAARMSTKSWRDRTVLDFIGVKKGGIFLWSSNNSVTVDEEFWERVRRAKACVGTPAEITLTPLDRHAWNVFQAVTNAAYYHGTGEPGFINVDKLTTKNEGLEDYIEGDFVGSSRYQLSDEAKELMRHLARIVVNSDYPMIVNPCGEIVLLKLGGYCVIADVVPYHAQDDDDAEDAFRVATRALMRTNLMDCLYRKEVQRTNRIGVGMTGLHEYAYKRFGYGWRDLIDEERSKDFWLMLSRFKRAVVDEAQRYAAELGVAVPHTNTTMKPAGTTSKLFGLTEGAHLPAMREYIRWVQYRNDDPLVAELEAKGYPVKRLKTYSGTTVVGFPTQPEICKLGMGDKLVTAPEATPEEQYQFLRLLEKYWIRGVEEDGVTPLPETGNQVSYTLKYDPEKVSFERFQETLLEGQSSVRCCSVMPFVDTSAYEYQPEQPVTKHEFELIAAAIQDDGVEEDVDFAHVDCGSGGCPVDFNKEKA